MKRTASILIVLMSACVQPISLRIAGSGGTLVVDGLITDQPGPYTIKLSRSISYDNSAPVKVYFLPERMAQVSVVDENGNTELLTEKAAGSYVTSALKGRVGGSYQLLIRTASGESYRSSFEKLNSVPAIGRVQYEYTSFTTEVTSSTGSLIAQIMQGFTVAIETTDPPDQINFYRWRADGIFEFFSVTENPAIRQCWAPLPRIENNIELGSDEHLNGQTFEHFVAIVPYNRPTKFLLNVRQQSLTEKAYQFWRQVQAQQTSTGTLFDVSPSPISGNVFNEASKDDQALGYFGASSIVTSTGLIDRFAAAGLKPPGRNNLPRAGDCRTHEENATNIKPEGF